DDPRAPDGPGQPGDETAPKRNAEALDGRRRGARAPDRGPPSGWAEAGSGRHFRWENRGVMAEPGQGESAVVIGNFDGVHRGHAALIRAARASEPGARLVAVTFWPHPMSVVRPDQTPLLLSTLERRTELLRNAGVDDVVVVHFTAEVASWSPAQFVDA